MQVIARHPPPPPIYPFRSRRRWWRKFASPRWLIYAGPVLLLPVVAVFLFTGDVPPTAIEQAISALPIPGNARDPAVANGGGRLQPLGTAVHQVPPSTSLEIYNRSAVVAAARLDRLDDGPAPDEDIADYIIRTYAALHPQRAAKEDLLVGNYALLAAPLALDLSRVVFHEFCTAQPGDPGYGTRLSDLPVDGGAMAGFFSFNTAADIASICPRLR
jgi:hypothetical protein